MSASTPTATSTTIGSQNESKGPQGGEGWLLPGQIPIVNRIPFPSKPTPAITNTTTDSKSQSAHDRLHPNPSPSSSHRPTIDNLSSTLASTSLSASTLATPTPTPTPSISHSHPTSASSTSIASLSESDQVSATETGMTSPQEEETGLDDAVARYKEGLYAYTRGLYIQAKLVSTRKDSSTTPQAKPSGMEKMAAKKALSRRLNG